MIIFFRFFIDNLKKEISFKDIELQEKIMELESKRKRLFFMNEKVKKDLESHDIIHKDKKGFNVIVKLNKDKEKIISYCEENDLEYFICPHYMKVKEDAISIEVQRK